ncbi:zinc-ribbon domain-containing protein, partial [Curtobacterium sp. B8]|uniref:zinc-ribbon domain-containing protein n=1 Tax=Curtobacterium sp. B8 TaxID=95611 RepID=UPI0035E41BD3
MPSFEQEPPLDPDAFAPGSASSAPEDDPEVTRVADRAPRAPGSDRGHQPTPDEPVWQPPAQQSTPAWQPPAPEAAPAAPSTRSWWIGRSAAPAQEEPGDRAGSGTPSATPGQDQPSNAADAALAAERPAPVASPPQPGDTAVVEPLVDRRPAPQRPVPLVTPGSAGATCHVCGHALEPDDIFCSNCGAVRPAVTAAFTGPVVPLPVARPDWAAEDEGPGEDEAAAEDDEQSDARERDGNASDDVIADDDEVADRDGPSERDAALHHAAVAGDEPEPEPTAGAGRPSEHTATEATPDATADGASSAPDDDHLFRAAVRPRGLHAAPVSTDSAGEAQAADDPAGAPEGAGDAAAPITPVPRAAPLPPIPGMPDHGQTAAPERPAPPLQRPSVPSSAGTDLDDGDVPDDSDDQDVDETRIVSKTPTHAPVVLHFSTASGSASTAPGSSGAAPAAAG